MIAARALPDAKMLGWSAALLLAGGPLLGLLFGSVMIAALAFGFRAVHRGLGQLWASENGGGRLIGIALILGGASTVVDAAVWMLPGAGF